MKVHDLLIHLHFIGVDQSHSNGDMVATPEIPKCCKNNIYYGAKITTNQFLEI